MSATLGPDPRQDKQPAGLDDVGSADARPFAVLTTRWWRASTAAEIKGRSMRDKAMIGLSMGACADNLFLVLGKIRQAGGDSPEAVHWL